MNPQKQPTLFPVYIYPEFCRLHYAKNFRCKRKKKIWGLLKIFFYILNQVPCELDASNSDRILKNLLTYRVWLCCKKRWKKHTALCTFSLLRLSFGDKKIFSSATTIITWYNIVFERTPYRLRIWVETDWSSGPVNICFSQEATMPLLYEGLLGEFGNTYSS